MGTIDVRRQVAEMEEALRSQMPRVQRREALAVLERWQWDEMVDGDSRQRARQLVREFGPAVGRASGVAFWGAPSLRPAEPVPMRRATDDLLGARREHPFGGAPAQSRRNG
jgi:hypothetical protein